MTLTGVLELLAAGGLLLPVVAPLPGAGLVVLLVVMFPANIRAALENLPADLTVERGIPKFSWSDRRLGGVHGVHGVVPDAPRHGSAEPRLGWRLTRCSMRRDLGCRTDNLEGRIWDHFDVAPLR